jgi:voltage-gated potassium channel
MIKLNKNTWGLLLLFETFTIAFLVPFFDETYWPWIYQILYTTIYFTSIMSLDQNRRRLIFVSASIFLFQIISKINENESLETVLKITNFVFFLFIAISFIVQISRARNVTARVILEAINAYLLMGVLFSILVSLLVHHDPNSFSFGRSPFPVLNSLYFGFVSMSTLGYGDMLPISPQAKSLATLISVCGQLYLAIIVALLVGKISSKQE